jgi:predicted ATPase
MLRTAARPLSRGASLVAQYDRKVAAGTLIKDSTQREALRRLERLRQELLAHGSAMVEYQHAVCHTGLEPRAGVLLTGLLIM